MKPDFVARSPPLPPRAVVGLGAAARALGLRLFDGPDETLRQLNVVAGDGLLVALGPADLLPWVDGAIYLGSDAAAPALLMPTTQATALHPQLVERALRGLPGLKHGQLAVLPRQQRIVCLSRASPAGRQSLLAWLEAGA